jgi:hypothetical protein
MATLRMDAARRREFERRFTHANALVAMFKAQKVPVPFLEESIANARSLMIDSPSFGFACPLVPRSVFSAKRDTAPLTRHICTC